jgi:putative phosphoesterase
MKIGIITDIHNNLIALESVLECLNNEKCDKIICCGDIIGIGPYPEETVQRIMKIRNFIGVRGNHERYLIEGVDSNMDEMDESEKEHHLWEHSRLSQSSIDFLRALPYSRDLHICGKKITILHYAMNDKKRFVNHKASNIDDLIKIYEGVDSDIIIYGHEHKRNICNGDKLYVNVGSLGCPASDKNIARFGILNISENCLTIDAKEVTYDVKQVVDKINEYNYPAADAIKKIFYAV